MNTKLNDSVEYLILKSISDELNKAGYKAFITGSLGDINDELIGQTICVVINMDSKINKLEQGSFTIRVRSEVIYAGLYHRWMSINFKRIPISDPNITQQIINELRRYGYPNESTNTTHLK